MPELSRVPKRNLTARIAPADLDRLRKLAERTGRKPTAIVREILLEHLDQVSNKTKQHTTA